MLTESFLGETTFFASIFRAFYVHRLNAFCCCLFSKRPDTGKRGERLTTLLAVCSQRDADRR